MELSTAIKKVVNSILIRKFVRRKRKHSAIVESNIDTLYNYHTKNTGYDFIPLRKKLLTDILIYARKHSKYYKDILPQISRIKTMSEAEFQRIPLLTKDLIRKNAQDLKSHIVPEKCLIPIKTSGSTGNPLAFLASGNTDAIHQKFLYDLYNYKPGDKILAMDGTILEDYLSENGIFWKIKNNGNMLPYGGMALYA